MKQHAVIDQGATVITDNSGVSGRCHPVHLRRDVSPNSSAPYGPHDKAQDALWTLYRAHGTWRAVAALVPGFTQGFLFNVAQGKRRASDDLLVALGFQRRAVPVQPCPDCGEVHTVGWCVKQHGEPEMPKPRRVRKSSPYIRAWPAVRLRWAFDNREVMA